MPLAQPVVASPPEPYSVKREGVSVARCDDEPVRTPGCVQGHGVLLAVRPGDLTVVQVSANCGRWLGRGPAGVVGRPLADVLGVGRAGELAAFLAAEPVEGNPMFAFTTRVGDGPPLDVTVHLAGGVALVELEPTGRSDAAAVDYFGLIKRATGRMTAAGTVAAFCQVAVDEVRAATGLDRVMAYRFHADHSGEVVAESRRSDLHAWVGLRYPADDVPRPAREIFKRIGVRTVPDAAGEAAEMVPLADPDTGRPLDMTHCALRGASVMYTEYLRNMGVAATLTMPILRDGELWGLLAGHHYTARPFTFPVRAAAEVLAQVASLHLTGAERREHFEYQRRVDAAHAAAVARAAHDGLGALACGTPGLRDGIACGGVAVRHAGQWWTGGDVPDGPTLDRIAGWVRASPDLAVAGRPVLATDGLGGRCPAAADAAGVASGLLAVPVSAGGGDLILWFRPEQAQTFTWGGNPHEKPTVVGPHGPRLTPRTSFDRWQEQVRGRSAPWLAMEVEAALGLRALVRDLVVARAEQMAAVNAELARSNDELDSFAYVASHDLKEPLRGINKTAHHLLEEARAGGPLGEGAAQRLESLLRLTTRMDGLLDALLHFARVGRLRLACEPQRLGDVLHEALEMLGAAMEESGAEVVVPRELPTVDCDRVRVREVLANLVANGVKYNDGPAKWVEVGYVDPGETPPAGLANAMGPAGDRRAFYVRDNGIGIDPRHHGHVFKIFKRLHARDAYGGGTGAGLAIVRKLVEQHGGRIWVASEPGAGSAFLFTLSGDAPTASSEGTDA